MGYAANQGGRFKGGGTQIVIENDLLDWIWDNQNLVPKNLPQH